MKEKIYSVRSVLMAFLALSILILTACGSKSSAPNPNDVNKAILSAHTWKLQQLMVDNVDRTSLYTGMTLTFGATSYTSTDGEPVWPANGTWSFTGTTGKTITRSDNLVVSIESITSDQLVLSLTWDQTTYGDGRESSVSGKHTYTFVK